MKFLSRLPAYLLLLSVLSPAGIVNSASPERKIIWKPIHEKTLPDESVFQSLSFEDAIFNEDLIPVYHETFPLPEGASDLNVQLSDIVVEPLRETSLVYHPEKIESDFKIITKIVTHKKKSSVSVTVVPIRKIGTTFEKLSSFNITTSPVIGILPRKAARFYSRTSVLASGEWYRISCTQNGVYRITYQQLKNMGLDIDNIDPRNIRLYGNGGGQLPFANNIPRHDDLQENAIMISGESDGIFNAGDFILFYGSEQTKWKEENSGGKFSHRLNAYSDTTYYFLTTDLGSGKRVQTFNSTATPSHTVTTFDDRQVHEAELVNLLKSGREWYGENLDNISNNRNFNFSFPNLVATDTVYLKISLLGRSLSNTGVNSNIFTITTGTQQAVTQPFTSVGSSPQDNFASPTVYSTSFFSNNSIIPINIQFASADPNGLGWVNYIQWNARRSLDFNGITSQLEFRDTRSAGIGNVSEFRIRNVNSSTQVWEITDPTNVSSRSVQISGNELSYIAPSDNLREYIAFNNTAYFTPGFAGRIENQNLHSLPNANMIIVTHPSFLSQANQVAQFHREKDNLTVNVVTTHQIFNEFSSGSQDVSAIRDFVKMFYDRAVTAADLPKYLLLFGDASYDNKYRISGNSNYVTSYQSAGSLNQTQTYMSDDFFALLDDNEGDWTSSEVIDLSVGRLPVRSTSEADAAVRKIIHYGGGNASPFDPSQPGAATVFGDWRNIVTFVADDQDSNTHFTQTDTLARRMFSTDPTINIEKIYLDAYNQTSTPGGNRYPDAQKAIVDRVQRGTLLLTYIGHGGEIGWAHERVLEINDINSWTNIDRLAAFLTATCEFTRVDDPGRTSAGEMVFLNPNGGGICLFTTSRLAFSSSNFNLSKKFFTHVAKEVDGRMPTIGEVFERTKIDVYADQYVRNFLLIGDPALKLAYPNYGIKTNTINGVDISLPTDTLKALSKITITGEVHDRNNQKLTSFNGVIYPTVYDKSSTYYTLGNDQHITSDPSFPAAFSLQKNIIYRGKATVTNGDFSFTFVVPKDIQFAYGKGKLSFYAHNGWTDAGGYNADIVTGGFNENVPADVEGPQIRLYINDEKFVRGGMTDKNPFLYAIVSDSSGINTVGTGIGHDMTGVLDNATANAVVLNEYFENDLNSYQQGRVRYQFKDIAPGPHTLNFKVWDVYNNSSEATTDFIVAESAELALNHVLNYPNPFTTNTTFMFEHNRPFSQLDIRVQVFTVSGKLIKTISGQIFSEGYRSDDLKWDGLDEFGDKIGKGVYVYKLRVRVPGGEYADKFEKLVILR